MTQSEALEVMKMGHNVFLTGAPGAGKTFVLNGFVKYLKKHGISVGITASTGIAATHIGGMTIHSWSGIGIKDYLSEEYLEKLAGKANIVKRFASTKVLIIDEISMLHGKRLDLVNQVCQFMKKNDKPFGGLQVILTGDLFQLPPVSRDRSDLNIDFAFKSQSWKSLRLKVCYLSEQHRQQDEDLLGLLNKIRRNEAGYEERDLLETRQTDDVQTSTTRLYTHNADVDSINAQQLSELSYDEVSFAAITKGRKSALESLIKSCLAPETLVLKEGAEVMTVVNDQAQRFVNGSRGVVVGFDEETNAPIIKLHDNNRRITIDRNTWVMQEGEKAVAELAQYPLRLAWAITIHKSQGMSLDEAEVDLGRSFEPGMGYVALSRLRSLEGLVLRGINELALRVHPEILQFDKHLQNQSAGVQNALKSLEPELIKEHHSNFVTKFKPTEVKYDKELFEKLKAWRTEQANTNKIPSYMVFDNQSLKLLTSVKPANLTELAAIKGIGPKKLESYGQALLDIMTSHDTTNN